MDTFDAINQRRSVKAFEPTHRFTTAEETKLLEAAIINLPGAHVIGCVFAVREAMQPAMPTGGQLALFGAFPQRDVFMAGDEKARRPWPPGAGPSVACIHGDDLERRSET